MTDDLRDDENVVCGPTYEFVLSEAELRRLIRVPDESVSTHSSLPHDLALVYGGESESDFEYVITPTSRCGIPFKSFNPFHLNLSNANSPQCDNKRTGVSTPKAAPGSLTPLDLARSLTTTPQHSAQPTTNPTELTAKALVRPRCDSNEPTVCVSRVARRLLTENTAATDDRRAHSVVLKHMQRGPSGWQYELLYDDEDAFVDFEC